MYNYYVNKNAQENGDHEVHKSGCERMPEVENRKYLGYFSNCQDAVCKAKEIYPRSNGCFYCSKDCHTT
jgi:hypothetical protein